MLTCGVNHCLFLCVCWPCLTWLAFLTSLLELWQLMPHLNFFSRIAYHLSWFSYWLNHVILFSLSNWRVLCKKGVYCPKSDRRVCPFCTKSFSYNLQFDPSNPRFEPIKQLKSLHIKDFILGPKCFSFRFLCETNWRKTVLVI